MELRDRRFGMQADRLVDGAAHRGTVDHAVRELADAGRRKRLEDRIGGGDQPVAPLRIAVLKPVRLRAQHQVREVHRPLVRRQIRTLRFGAQIAQIALIDHLRVVGLVDAVDFEGRRFVDQIEQRRKRIAQAHATTATVADFEHALEFRVKRVFRVELGTLPVDRAALRRLEISFACSSHRRYLVMESCKKEGREKKGSWMTRPLRCDRSAGPASFFSPSRSAPS